MHAGFFCILSSVAFCCNKKCIQRTGKTNTETKNKKIEQNYLFGNAEIVEKAKLTKFTV